MEGLTDKWQRIVNNLSYAFQPIVNIHTGVTYGFEALLRGWQDAGFVSIKEVFDSAYYECCLYQFDLALRAKAVALFLETGLKDSVRLFYNIDNRVLDLSEYSIENTIQLMNRAGLSHSTLYFEISEHHEFEDISRSQKIIEAYKEKHFRIAIDDYGSGYSGLQLLYHSDPDLIKIDRFFIGGIHSDAKKKLFVSNVVNLAHIMGIIVVAEGVETWEEYFICREMGCDFIQGYLVQRPTEDLSQLNVKYNEIESAASRDRRYPVSREDIIFRKVEYLDPITIDTDIMDILSLFRKNKNKTYFPVINTNIEPMGIIREKNLKHYVYSPFGISLLKNQAYRNDIYSFISKIPVVEIHTRLERIIEMFSLDKEAEAVIITENGRYRGVLDSKSLLEILSEQEIAEARDQNPLTKLPGNNVINGYVTDHIRNGLKQVLFVYFDFDDFKPYNDNYGFRNGDRIILLFADILKEFGNRKRVFIGHIGGDDFFMGVSLKEYTFHELMEFILRIVSRFQDDVKSFYNQEDRENGFISAKNRSGRMKKFPLMTVSASALAFGSKGGDLSLEEFGSELAALKNIAKKNKNKIAVRTAGMTGYREKEENIPLQFLKD